MNEKLITGFSAVRLFVSDLKRAVDFYRGTLGLELTAHDESLYAVFQLPNATVLVERVERGNEDFQQLVGRFSGISFSTSDIRGAFERLSGTGVRFDGPPERQSWGGILAHFHDPDNNVLTLVEYPAAA